MWKHYATSTDGFVFVIDGKDIPRLNEAKRALISVLSYYPEGSIPPILIILNKFDLPNESPPESLLATVTQWISADKNLQKTN